MLPKVRGRLTYANVMATIAVFVALGGTSYAALTVTGTNVKNGSLAGADIRNGSLTTSDVKDKSLLGKDFKAGQLPSGPTGVTGAPGATGSPAVSFLGGRSTYFDSSSNSYGSPIGQSVSSPTAASVDIVSPATEIVVRDLMVRLNGPSTPAITFSLAVNGVDSALTCTTSGSGATCSDTVDAVRIPAGSTLAIHQSHPVSGVVGAEFPYRFGMLVVTP